MGLLFCIVGWFYYVSKLLVFVCVCSIAGKIGRGIHEMCLGEL